MMRGVVNKRTMKGMTRIFANRHQAGQVLAASLARYAGRSDAVVLGLPRGGVPVAYEVARSLDLPLDVFLVLKLGAPGQPELALGAVAGKGLCVLNDEVVRALGVSKVEIYAAARHDFPELARRERAYRGERSPVEVARKTAILVDDGLATGASMRAAIQALRGSEPARIVAAVPVAPAKACSEVSEAADETVCAVTPEDFASVGMWYQDFSATSEAEVRGLLELAWHERTARRQGQAGS